MGFWAATLACLGLVVALFGMGVGVVLHDDLRAHLTGRTHEVVATVDERVDGPTRCGRRSVGVRRHYDVTWTADGAVQEGRYSSCRGLLRPGTELTVWVPDDGEHAVLVDGRVRVRTDPPWDTYRWAVWLPAGLGALGALAGFLRRRDRDVPHLVDEAAGGSAPPR
ncbi:hypothetical protein RDV89_15265 [Nocardioides zeae]|uniref:DUF3592 domain-containing protein n=1 Tax=Nocardioides imazamoxiresistens TaxID=3231893 RepID=A0ABU3PYX5_9ACTN|nr:hypothetical protein [Nocardioides zeae]MDT9594442.1 hypothetical protein [Nocardioides zeae]